MSGLGLFLCWLRAVGLFVCTCDDFRAIGSSLVWGCRAGGFRAVEARV